MIFTFEFSLVVFSLGLHSLLPQLAILALVTLNEVRTLTGIHTQLLCSSITLCFCSLALLSKHTDCLLLTVLLTCFHSLECQGSYEHAGVQILSSLFTSHIALKI